MKTKIYLGLFIVILIGSFIAVYNHAISENGRLTQEKTNLEQSLKDSEANLVLFQEAAAFNAQVASKTNKQKEILNRYALKKVHELEILKNENSDIKKWAITTLPNVLSGRLHDFAYNKDKIYNETVTSGAATADTRAAITILNESLYKYSIDGITALRQCNEDKKGVLDSILNSKE
jgi:hypothetical protein